MALAVLSVTGRNIGMLVSVAAMSVVLWHARDRSLRIQLGRVLIASLAATLLSETVHLIWHRVRDDVPDHQGFWMSAVLVGIINVFVVALLLILAEWWKHRAAPGDRP